MAFDFKFPDVGEGIHEGKIVKWLVKVGDDVKVDEAIAEVETDKAVVEIPSPQAGKVLKLYHAEGEMMKVGEVMATIAPLTGEVGGAANGAAASQSSDVSAAGQNAPAISTTAPTEQHQESTGVVGSLEPTAAGVMKAPTSMGGAVFSSGSQMTNVSPFGNNGPVFVSGNQTPVATQPMTAVPQSQNQPQSVMTVQNVQQNASASSQAQSQIVQPASTQAVSVSGGSMAGVIKSGIKAVKKYDLFGYIDRSPYDGVRKAVGEHMVKSVTTAPHVTHMDTADVTDLWAKREIEKKEAEKQGVKLTFLSYIIQALCEALKKHPFLNAMLDSENNEIILRKYYNIGIAVDTEAGLMVPVLKAADRKDVVTMAKEIAELAEKARTRKINPMDFKGGTFTVTNVGSAGSGKFFTPVINFPEAAILGIGLMEDTPIVRNGKVEVRKIVYLSLSYDHRILDGAEAARFMKDLKELLQGGPSVTKVDSNKSGNSNSNKAKKAPAKRLIAKKNKQVTP